MSHRYLCLILCASISVLTYSAGLCQTAPATSPQALNAASQALTAMLGGQTVTDVTLNGSATWNGVETGTVTLRAIGSFESRIDLQLPEGTRSTLRDAQTGLALGKWILPTNVSGVFPQHNCLTDAVWFFPALSSLNADPARTLVYIAHETRHGTSVEHLQSYFSTAVASPASTQPPLGTVDFYLDSNTFLPVAATFNMHPDNDATTNLSIEIDYSGYTSMNGITLPTHIQQYQQGTLLLDIEITGASLNTGLPLSLFAI